MNWKGHGSIHTLVPNSDKKIFVIWNDHSPENIDLENRVENRFKGSPIETRDGKIINEVGVTIYTIYSTFTGRMLINASILDSGRAFYAK